MQRMTSAASLLTSVDDLFTTQAERDEAKLEKIQLIPLEELKPFRDHPFKVQNDAEMERIVESVRKVGVISPGLARPLEDGGYELVSGHRRLAACRQAGLETMPVLVREMTKRSSRPSFCTISLNTNSAIGLRQIFPRQTNMTLIFSTQ